MVGIEIEYDGSDEAVKSFGALSATITNLLFTLEVVLKVRYPVPTHAGQHFPPITPFTTIDCP